MVGHEIYSFFYFLQLETMAKWGDPSLDVGLGEGKQEIEGLEASRSWLQAKVED